MTGYYPRGKLCENDEGACHIAIFVKDKTVIIDFGKELKWIGFDKAEAILIAQAIIEKANSIEV